MDREENEIHYASKRERLFALTIFLLMVISFCLHLCVFGDIFFKNHNNQTEIIKSNNTISTDDLFGINLLPLFCLSAHLIWIIVPIVVLDRCCISNTKSIPRILLKLFICTIPLLLSSELSILFLSHVKNLRMDFLLIIIKWLVFVGTIILSFWTGILSDQHKWRGIHGGQIAPEQHSPLFLFEN